MKRYTLSPVTGAGTFQSPFRAAVSDVSQTNTNSLIPTHGQGHPDEGQPKYNFALSIVGTANLAGVLAVSNSYVFPDYPLDGEMGGMEAETRTAFEQSVEAYDLDGAGLHLDASHQSAESWRTVLTRIGQQIEPAFNVNNFDAQEPGQ